MKSVRRRPTCGEVVIVRSGLLAGGSRWPRDDTGAALAGRSSLHEAAWPCRRSTWSAHALDASGVDHDHERRIVRERDVVALVAIEVANRRHRVVTAASSATCLAADRGHSSGGTRTRATDEENSSRHVVRRPDGHVGDRRRRALRGVQPEAGAPPSRRSAIHAVPQDVIVRPSPSRSPIRHPSMRSGGSSRGEQRLRLPYETASAAAPVRTTGRRRCRRRRSRRERGCTTQRRPGSGECTLVLHQMTQVCTAAVPEDVVVAVAVEVAGAGAPGW